jgi:hypothetical protein
MFRNLVVLAFAALLTGCVSYQPAKVYSSGVRSILVAPVVSKSVQVGSDVQMYAMTTMPIGERGYYPFPVETVKTVLESEGLYEPEKVRELGPEKLAAMFGSDAVLYIDVLDWDAQYALIKTVTKVRIHYSLVKNDGAVLASNTFHAQVESGGQGNSLIGSMIDAVAAAIQRAAPNYEVPAASCANQVVWGWEAGPYLNPGK